MICETCRQPDPTQACALCANALCENCVMSPPVGAFSLLPSIPPALSHREYCRFCYDAQVEPALAAYLEAQARAEEVFIFFTTQRKEIPLVRRSKEVLRVENCPDRDETILRLAFMAAEKGFNAVVETEVNWEKRRNHAHHTTFWKGTGSPAMIDEAKLSRQERQNAIFERG